MRIAVVIWQLDMYGGSIRQALELARFLKKQKNEVDVFSYTVNKEKCFPEIIKKINVITPQPTLLKQMMYDPGDFFLVRIFAFLYNMVVQKLQVSALSALLQEKHKEKHYDVINIHDNGLLDIPPHIKDARFVWMMNDPPSFIDTFEKQASVFSNSLLLKFLVFFEAMQTRLSLRNIEKVVVLDKRNAKIVKKYFHVKAQIVRSGLDIPRTVVKKRPLRNKLLKILTTNIFFRHRRYEDLVEAVKILVKKIGKKNVQFRIVGASDADEAYHSKIRAMVTQYDLDDIFVFLGRVNEKQLKDEYKNADIFVFPNHNQTWGLSVFEAMLNACAVIVSSSCGACDVLTDKVNARIVGPKNPKMLARVLEDIILHDKERNEMSLRGQEFVMENISWKKYAQQMAKIFTDQS